VAWEISGFAQNETVYLNYSNCRFAFNSPLFKMAQFLPTTFTLAQDIGLPSNSEWFNDKKLLFTV